MPTKTMSEAIEELARAMTMHATAAANAKEARRAEIDALNAVNAAQEAVNMILVDLRNSAPADSDWWRERQPKYSA